MKNWWHHPAQSWWCAVRSFLLGRSIQHGKAWHPDGTDYWWHCGYCGAGDSSL